ncbi:MAG: helix-turn-helix transcriptional regulator [Saprospiraceae bacterium]|nr:helix-turn-helix transcriptional regulator [Saprospiraceae bacterium]
MFLLVFLLAFGAAQGLLLLFYLLGKISKRPSTLFLILILCTVLLQMLIKIWSKTWLMQNIGFIYSLSYKLPLFIGPLLWFYTRSTLQEKLILRWQDGIHWVPFLISCIALINYLFFPYQNIPLLFIPFRPFSGTGELAIQLACVGLYTWFSFQFAQNQRLKQFILVTGFLELFIAIAFKFLSITHPIYAAWRWSFLLLTIYFYWVTYQLLQHGFDFDKKAVLNGKYTNSGLKPTQIQPLQKQLQQLMHEHKPFLNSNLNIEQLAKLMGISRHHLSQVLNEGLQKTYHDFVNEYRLEVAKNLLNDASKQHYSIAAIAFEAGFNSLSSFNLVFKKHLGVTPSEFRNSVKTIPNLSN